MSTEGFSAAQISHYQAITLQHFIKGPTFYSGIQEKPLVAKMEAKKKPFRAGLEKISVPVKFETGAGGTNDKLTGFSHTDTVTFYNPGNALRAEYIWREHHLGMTLSETELKQQGILVQDSPRKISKGGKDRGLEILADALDEANRDFMEQYADTLNDLLWGDGSVDPSGLHGIRAFIHDIPTIGTVGGLNAATYPRWRNIAFTAAFAGHASFDANHGGDAITSNPANGGALIQALQKMWRQLRRYGGRPDCFFAGADFIDAMETELRANGNYSDTGFTGKQDGSMGEMMFKKVPVIYDPTLDDLGKSKFAYIWDSSDITLRHLEGDWRRQRTPERPYDSFVFHQSVISTGQLTARRRNSAAVVQIN